MHNIQSVALAGLQVRVRGRERVNPVRGRIALPECLCVVRINAQELVRQTIAAFGEHARRHAHVATLLRLRVEVEEIQFQIAVQPIWQREADTSVRHGPLIADGTVVDLELADLESLDDSLGFVGRGQKGDTREVREIAQEKPDLVSSRGLRLRGWFLSEREWDRNEDAQDRDQV